MTTLLDVAFDAAEGAVRLGLSGELDMVTGPQLEAALRRAEGQGAGVVVVDLRELTFMDSTGLNVLLRADVRARDGGWQLRLVRGPGAIQRVFNIAGLDDRLTFVEPDDVHQGGA